MISGTDQNSAYSSLKDSLIPAANLIDGRSEEDMLCFLSKFASVINFYNQDNLVQGNWAPLILKDPVFLTAMISRIQSKELYARFGHNCHTLKTLLNADGTNSDNSAFISFTFNTLFDQIAEVYGYFRDWIYYMERSQTRYEFKRFVTTNIRDIYSQYFWALIALKEAMHKTSIVPAITAPPNLADESYSYTEQIIWQTGMGKAPYWEVLDMGHRITFKTQPQTLLGVLQKTGEIVFDFLDKCVSYAATEYTYLKQKKSSYPDTLLLRGFVDLLKIHQSQLNDISKKHLDFYYRDILLQRPLPGATDSAYLCTTLSKPGMLFTLPANTLFSAGTDSRKKPVVFSNPQPVTLNSGVVTDLKTLSISPLNGGQGIYLNTVSAPGTVKTDQQGSIIGFDTFGNTNNQGTQATGGIAFASPMFLLKEGIRTITITMTCINEVDTSIFDNAEFYFSTAASWLAVNAVPLPTPPGPAKVMVLRFQLDATQPPVEPFRKNPDMLDTQWPLFKIQFQQVPDLANPPVIKKIEIDVLVNGIKSLQLYNDYGTLSTKAPFQFMGPAPMPGSNFIVGSSEIFSKPVKSFSLEIDWNGLPADFKTYYLQYNQYLEGDMDLPPAPKPCWLIKLKDSITGKKPEITDQKQPNAVFNNCCFTVAFQLLQNRVWTDLDLRNSGACIIDAGASDVNVPPAPTTLFATTNNVLDTTSTFSYIAKGDAIIPDAALQGASLKYTGQNASGFIKMTLNGPGYGFGSLLYPAIVFQITLDNAQQIADKKAAAFTALTPKPFIPKVTAVSATYSANTTVNFSTPDSTNPMQCFIYTPFQNYKVFDAASGVTQYNYTYSGDNKVDDTGIPMFAPLSSAGYLFTGLDNLVAPGPINLYFELARVYAITGGVTAISYSYLSTTGWKTLEILADGTNNFSCSGIIKANIPPDIDYDGLPDNQGKCWLAISVSAQPQSYAQTVFCATNGFIARRTQLQQGAAVTHIPAATISKTSTAVPQLGVIQQPFASFGGKVEETAVLMNLRVSNRIKTKDRAAAADDFFRIIVQSFPDIFYAKTVFNKSTNVNQVYLVKAFAGPEITGAFTPLVTACAEKQIRELLVAKSSCFVSIGVANFNFQFVKVTVDLVAEPANGTNEIAAQVGQQLDLFLSPWISSTGQQVTIDAAITTAQVAAFVAGLRGVQKVNNVRLQTWTNPATEIATVAFTSSVKPFDPSMLLVSNLGHNINCKIS
ncbi:hypothetical protein GWR56_13225 [Mucilaginibacter sp. 14171R-50]|uniref:hypothetical protein n=1 Tax=Mucilaginibacter sp. 14171R-50 TaxID=2703789 RepID=UPI00138D8A2D|nr:hypothetical protein [Mucilaginibacter sp. 14171R-50]QHS56452.1 hypothetical protein GWR56_13225 [Mucilaginibacter sp. 14171R-50]